MAFICPVNLIPRSSSLIEDLSTVKPAFRQSRESPRGCSRTTGTESSVTFRSAVELRSSFVPKSRKTFRAGRYGRYLREESSNDLTPRATLYDIMPEEIVEEVDWEKLQNGSDIRGIAIDSDVTLLGTLSRVKLTDGVIHAIATAFADWLAKKKGKPRGELRVAVGMDSRISGPNIKAETGRALQNAGVAVFDVGLAPTPALFRSTVTDGFLYDGAVMITASHHPFNRNGFKLFTDQGGLGKSEITELLDSAAEFYGITGGRLPKAAANIKPITVADFVSVYANDIVSFIRKAVNDPSNFDKPLSGFKILVDSGNGVGGYFVDKVLEPLGADTTGSLYLDPNGLFPNHGTQGADDDDAIKALARVVRRTNADLAVLFDADCGRCAAVGKNGVELNKNRFVALMSAIVLNEHPGSTIVTDSVTSSGLTAFIKGHGGGHVRFKRGYQNVINEAKRLNGTGVPCFLAMETSGHGALKDNFFIDDGAFLIAKILVEMARLRLEGSEKDVTSLVADLKEPAESVEFRLSVRGVDFNKYATRLLYELNNHSEATEGWKLSENNHEGVRVSFRGADGSVDGWFLVRKSLHDPVLCVNMEANSRDGLAKLADPLFAFLASYRNLDLTPLRMLISS